MEGGRVGRSGGGGDFTQRPDCSVHIHSLLEQPARETRSIA